MNQAIINKFKQLLPLSQLHLNEPLKNHTTLKIGGPADLFFEAKTEDQLVKAVHLAQKLKSNYFILGWGSNLLISDAGFRGLIIKNLTSDIRLLSSKPAPKKSPPPHPTTAKPINRSPTSTTTSPTSPPNSSKSPPVSILVISSIGPSTTTSPASSGFPVSPALSEAPFSTTSTAALTTSKNTSTKSPSSRILAPASFQLAQNQTPNRTPNPPLIIPPVIQRRSTATTKNLYRQPTSNLPTPLVIQTLSLPKGRNLYQ
jgi:hypothetical protein